MLLLIGLEHADPFQIFVNPGFELENKRSAVAPGYQIILQLSPFTLIEDLSQNQKLQYLLRKGSKEIVMLVHTEVQLAPVHEFIPFSSTNSVLLTLEMLSRREGFMSYWRSELLAFCLTSDLWVPGGAR